MTDGAANGAAAYPTWIALNSDASVWITWGAGTVTILLGCLIVHGVIQGLNRIESVTATFSSEPEEATARSAKGTSPGGLQHTP